MAKRKWLYTWLFDPKGMHILIAEDEPRSLLLLKSLLQDFFSFQVEISSARTVKEAVSSIQFCPPDLLFLDMQLGNQSGFDVLEKIQERRFHFVVVSASREFAYETIQLGGSGYLLKPISKEDLFSVLHRLLVAMGKSC